jgi:hypothetical protein
LVAFEQPDFGNRAYKPSAYLRLETARGEMSLQPGAVLFSGAWLLPARALFGAAKL